MADQKREGAGKRPRSMTIRRVRASTVLAAAWLALTVLALTACGSGHPAGAGSASSHQAIPATPAPTRTAGPVTNGCGPQPARYAWAVDVTTAGRIIWQTALTTRNVGFAITVQPLVVGTVAVLAQDGIVHGLDLGDGHPLWSWTGGQDVYGMWRWGGLVVVLTDQVSTHSRLTGLDAATGAVRWSLRLPGRGLLGGQAATADGGLAMVTTVGVLQVVNLADGTVRWRRTVGASPALTAAGQLVIFGVSGRLTGYDDRTGQPRWTTGGLPDQPTVQLAGGLVLVLSNTQGPGITTALTAVLPATGRIAWRFDPGESLTVLSAGPDPQTGLTVAAYVFNRRLYLLDPRTGRPRWQAATFVAQGIIPLVTRTDVLTVEGQSTIRLVDRAATDGRVRWQDTLTEPPVGQQQVLAAGPLAVLQGDPATPGHPAPLLAYQLASGRPAWRVDMPTFVVTQPVLTPGHVLVQPADLMSACAAAG
jgi:outer membrane protein assembly factor BamB